MKLFSNRTFEMWVCGLVAALTTACSATALDEVQTDEYVTPDTAVKQVTFGMQPTLEAMASTRATAAEPTLLLVLDMGPDGRVTPYTRNVSADTDVTGGVLDNLTLPLQYGTHTLYFVAADSPFMLYDTTGLTVQWDAQTGLLKNCWAQKAEITVNQETATAQQIVMPIRVANIQMTIEDGISEGASSLEMSLSAGSWQLDLQTMSGVEATTVGRNISIQDSYIGVKGLTVNIYTFVPEGQQTVGTLSARAYDADNSEITSHILNNVPAAAAHITRYKGMFFSNSQEFELSVENEWTVDEETY